MAKTKHNNFIDTVNEIIGEAKNRGVVQLYTEDASFSGRKVKINGKEMCHFGTTSYLGLDQDIRLKEASINAIKNYGTQFPLSKMYISHSVYAELEHQLYQMYGQPVIVTKNSTLGHLGIIPTVVRDEDVMILDHQVHWSVQNAAQISKSRGVTIEMIRHNSIEMLEYYLKKYNSGNGKIWYFADGIYSMYGDSAPIEELMQLSKKYPKLHLYFDDVHGMSWSGKKGTGFVNSHFDELPENIIIIGTLSKTFGASGAFMVTSNKKFYSDVKNFGGPLTFSAQLEPAAVAAASASAAIHLTDEIYNIQNDLAEKVAYCNEELDKTNLPIVVKNNCPVFFVAGGTPAIGFKLTKRLMDDGFFVNLGIFPAVPIKNTGVRFTVCRHNEKPDIKALVECINYHHPKVLEEENYSLNKVRKFFNMPLVDEDISRKKNNTKLNFQVAESIQEIDKDLWNSYFGKEGLSDYDGLLFQETYFQGHEKPEENWKFRYVIITDQDGLPIVMTYFTLSLWKDDTLAPASTSISIEQIRKTEPYYFTSMVLSIGSLITEGQMFYLNDQHTDWKSALNLFFECVDKIDEELEPAMITLRDFHSENPELKKTFFDKGYVKIVMPDSCIHDQLSWTNKVEYLDSLSPKSRRNFRRDVEPFIDKCDLRKVERLTSDELTHCYELVKNVWEKNFDLNIFLYEKSFFEAFMNQSGSHALLLYKLENGKRTELPCAVLFCYTSSDQTYVPVLIGIDYEHNVEFSIYRQMLYHAIMEGKKSNCTKLNFGFSASFEKKKLGAKLFPTIAYIQAKDNFSIELLGVIQNQRNPA